MDTNEPISELDSFTGTHLCYGPMFALWGRDFTLSQRDSM